MKDVLSEEYFNWIEDQTMKYGRIFAFSGYNENSSLIVNLFERVNQYIKENYKFDSSEYGEMYNIKKNGIGYELGVLYGPDRAYYIGRADNANLEGFIDIEDIRSNRLSNKDFEIIEKMSKIKKAIDELSNMGVSLKLIDSEVDAHIRKLSMEGRNGNNNSK